MLFDQETNKLQLDFNRLERLEVTAVSRCSVTLKINAGFLQVSAPGKNRLRLQVKRIPEHDYGILMQDFTDPETSEMYLPIMLVEDAQQPGAAEEDKIRIKTGDPGSQNELELVFQRQPVSLSIYRQGKLVLESSTDRAIQGDYRLAPIAASPEAWLFSLALQSSESVFGLGEKFGDLNKRNQLIENWNRDATGVNAEISYKNVPFAWSPRGWGLFVHTTARVTHGVGYSPWSHRSYVIKVNDPNLDVFFLFADSPAAMLENYTELTGRTALPPLWSYGMWMSRAYYKTADELIEVAHKLRQRRIPCDVLTLDGRAWHKPETRFDFSWDPDRYPDPLNFINLLQSLNYRLCLWEYSYLSSSNPLFEELAEKKYFLQTQQGEVYIYRWLPPPHDKLIPHLQPSGMIDFTNPEAYAWYRDMHRPLFEMGISVMKTDYGEAVPEDVVGHNGDTGKRLHNVYSLLYNRCVFEASQMYGHQDGLVWGRSSWAGGQRYPVQWGGDPQSDWEGLAASIRGGLSWGMSGGAFYTHDIGGLYNTSFSSNFLGGGIVDAELYVRWTQAGIMTSHTRFHGTGPREPWEFAPEIEDLTRRWLGWRYQMIPYLQACAEEASLTGMPVMRAMPLAFPNQPLSWNFQTQYMLGPTLLVAAVVSPGGEVTLFLPDGDWYDIWTGEHLQGPQMLNLKMPLARIPIYGRGGAALLVGPAVQHTGELTPDRPVQRIIFGKQTFILSLRD